MASAIGAALISTSLSFMVDKAMDKVMDKPMDKVMAMVVDKVDGIVNIERDISNLQTTLRILQSIVRVAEEKQIDDDFIQNWLRHLVDIAYEARDVLDDVNTFSSCIIRAEETSNPVNFISSLMLSYFGGLSSDTSNIPLTVLNRLEKDIRSVTERFDVKIKESEKFNTLRSVVGGGGSERVSVDRRPEVGPYINKQRDGLFLGREEVKQEIMEKILHPSDDRVDVVVIWGMGGIGKTTLAQSIYNDERVRVKKVLRKWSCVGESKFCAKKVITKITGDSSTDDVESLQEKLVEKFEGNRFLIVLDDVWDVDGREWDLLFNPLTNVGKGGMIIITRREKEVRPALINIQTPYNLEPLSEEDSRSIFESCAYVDGKADSTSELKLIGEKIVKKLNGHPLALKVVGRSLLNKDSSTWKKFLESKFPKDDEVMSALRWSYNHLPPHLKTCFTYCALFPKDHALDKKELVEMWMAHDLIEKEKQKRPEDVGAQYFEQLVNASLLQCVDGKHVMHGLIHDLALLVSNGEIATANGSLSVDQMVRHITLTHCDYSKIPRLCKIEKLLTLYTTGNQIYTTEKFDHSALDYVFKQLKSIRVLVLDFWKITDIPGFISKLKHLRYLDVSKTNVRRLPDSLCHLYNLQMLAAPLNAKLPIDIVNISSLRYVRASLSTCKGVGKLTSLQELSSIHVCEGDNIRELGDMQILRGKLTIRGLGNVEKLEDDVGALMNKQTLMDELVLEFHKQLDCWSWERALKFDNRLEKSTISEEVLDALGCPPNLTYLRIAGYNGLKLPSWMVSVLPVVRNRTSIMNAAKFMTSLSRLEICDCNGLKQLQLEALVSLKELDIRNCSSLVQITSAICESLKILNLPNCESFRSLSIDIHGLDSLENLDINGCPKLELAFEDGSSYSSSSGNSVAVRLHTISTDNTQVFRTLLHHELVSLESLEIRNLGGFENFDEKEANNFCKSRSFKRLRILQCKDLKSLPTNFHKLSSLEKLQIHTCRQLQSLPPDFHKLSSLKSLSIYDCPQLQSLPPDFHKLSSLKSLSIDDCPQLQSLPPDFHKLSSLKSLSIRHCPHLQSLPPDFHKLSSLEELIINRCPQLQSLPADGLPPSLSARSIIDCPKINHIPWTDISLLDDEEEEEEKEEDQDDDHSDDDLLFETKIMASAIGTAMVSTILQPMAAKAMDIIKDKGLEIDRYIARKAVDKAVDKAMDKAMDKVVDKVDGIVNIERDISNLQTTLSMLQSIVRVAEEKQIDDDFIRNWLRDLVDIAYEARDVLDDFNTFSSCVITAYEETSNPVNFTSSPMLSCFGGLSSDTSELPLTVLNQLEKDIRSVRERFDGKKKEAEEFKTLKSVVGEDSESVKNRRPEVGPFINKQSDHKFEERKEMKEGIVRKILHPSDDRVHVVVIWGMGGIGKTTLAQSIYNDKRVKEVPRSWFCVGENKFSTEKVIKEILNDKKTIGIGNLQTKLKEKLRGDRFLIVLDDVWDVDGSEWDILFNPLTNVGKGGLIIITKREREVCPAITIQTAYNLKPLSEEESWSIFESCAYANGKSDGEPDLKGIGKEIVKKLNGHPLALKVVGRSLLNKDYSTWTNFLESNGWMLRKEDDVMSALIWSYNHLPSHIQMCFPHCSLFPKDHVFIEKVLVEMWMAHDLIQKVEQKRPEDVGYFQELVNASLLQCVNGKYVMHDMIHDLALFVSNEEFATANGLLSTDQMERVRHISITPGGYSVILSLRKIEKLLTLYTICSDEYINWFDDSVLDDVFKQLKSIRVLVLSSEWIYEIPDCISELKHLRYLDVSRTSVKSLPDSLCHLYNLQMIAAPLDAVLPRNIVNMVNLRYVRANLSTCKGIGKLTSLQELSSIHVCKDDNIRELEDMQRLRGKLRIKGLENVEKLEDADGALMEKQTLIHELELEFDKQLEKSTISEKVLDSLTCPPKLTYLKIVGYTGVKPEMYKFDKLQTLELSDCPKLESLPPLGELTSLKHFSLWNVGVKRLGDEFYGKFTDSKVFFPSLESLRFYDMKGWEKWDDIIIKNSNVSFFPRLTRLEIHRCPKLLIVLPVVKEREDDEHSIINASLSRLEICDCGQLKRLQLHALVSLKELTIARCSSLVEITSGICPVTTIERQIETMDFKELPSLKLLDVSSCYNLISIPRLVGIKFLNLYGCQSVRSVSIHGLDSLEQLNINICPVLELIFEEGSSSSSSSGNSVAVGLQICTDKNLIFTKLFQHKFDSLKSLHIESVVEFENFGKTEEYDFCNLRSLKSLCISRCKDLKSLPAHFHKLSSLSSLKIENCPELQSLPPDFHRLSSLNSVKIVDCPKLQSLPAGGFPPSVKSLELLNCPLLYERCKDESGFYWHKIKRIPKLTIFGDHKVHRYGGGW